MKRFFQRLLGRERRKADRRMVPGLVAYYWDGGAPVEHPVGQISSTGMYLVTEQRWYMGTVLIMRLQQKSADNPELERSIAVQAKVAWTGPDGVGLAFASPARSTFSNGGPDGQNDAADKKSVDRFIRQCFLHGDQNG